MAVPPRHVPHDVRSRTDSGRANRVPLEVPVQLRTGGTSCAGVTKNVGSGGIFVATARLLRAGDQVTVSLAAGGDAPPLEALAEVRWCRQFEELGRQPTGVGLRFIVTPLRAALLTHELRRSLGPAP